MVPVPLCFSAESHDTHKILPGEVSRKIPKEGRSLAAESRGPDIWTLSNTWPGLDSALPLVMPLGPDHTPLDVSGTYRRRRLAGLLISSDGAEPPRVSATTFAV